ncbi:MAG: hypothetical protein ACFHX7_23050 [Pseudomonadota bacterium]
MSRSSQAALNARKKPTTLDLRPHSAAVTLLGSSSRNLDLDFWAKVILSENLHLRMGIEEMRERIIARIEEAIMSGDQPPESAFKALGVPSFSDLVKANAAEFAASVVARVRAESR